MMNTDRSDMKKKFISILTIICVIMTLLPLHTIEADADTLSPDSLIAHARKHIGDKYNTFYDRKPFTTDWCSQFIQHCSAKGGLSTIIPTSGCANVNDMAYNVVDKKGGKITFVNKTFYNAKKGNFKAQSRVQYNASYKPQKGDLIIFSSDGSYYWSHIGIVASDCTSTFKNIHTIEGNTGGGGYTTSKVSEYKNRATSSSSKIVAYVTPKYNSRSDSTYTIRYSDGLSSTTNDSSVIAPTVMTSGKSSATTTKKFTRAGYHYNYWHIYRYIDGKAYYWCRETKTGANGRWIAYDNIPSNYSKVKVAHGSKLMFTLSSGTVVYLKPVWENNRYILRYDDGDPLTADDGDIIPETAMVADELTYTTDKKFSRDGYTYDYWYLYKNINGKACYWCKKSGSSDGKWLSDGEIPSDYSKVKIKHGGQILFRVAEGTVIYMTPVWEKEEIPDTGAMEIVINESQHISDRTYTGGEIRIDDELKIYDRQGELLDYGKDYVLHYYDNTDVGTATVKATGVDRYSGTAEISFNIIPADINEKTIKLEYETVEYDGTEKEPAVVLDGMYEGADYEVEYAFNIEPGTAEVRITGKGNYTGTVVKTFEITGIQVPDDVPAYNKENRVAGSNRYQTAMMVADELKAGFAADKFGNIIVAYGDNYADALSGGYLAKVKQAPILLTNEYNESHVIAYIQKNLEDGGTVYLLGGTGVVSQRLENELKSECNVIRLGGADRYETNMAILRETGTEGGELLVCSASDFADSLSASAVGKPVLLVGKAVVKEQIEFIKASGISKCYMIGGDSAVSRDVETAIGRIVGSTERVGGDNRYETSQNIALRFFPGEHDNIVLASGDDFPDGLVGGTIGAVTESPLILVNKNNISAASYYTHNAKTTRCVILGGEKIISDTSVDMIMP